MNKIKLELWDGKIPYMRNINQNKISEMKTILCRNFFNKIDGNYNTLYLDISTHEKILGHIEILNIAQIIQELNNNISLNNEIYLDYGNFEKIIAVSLSDFVENINNFWYPSSDDLSIFNSDCTWVLTIYHYGTVSILQSIDNTS